MAENNVSGRHFWGIKNEKHVTVSQISLSIDLPYTSERQFEIEIIKIPIILPSNNACKILKGTNNLTDEEISNCYIFEKGVEKEGIDVTIIIGEEISEKTQNNPLLLMRFHNGYENNPTLGENIYQQLMSKNTNISVGRSGFEVCRTGGSGGLTTNPTSDKLLEFLHTHSSSTPRVSKAIKVVQKATTYKLYYIGVRTTEKKVAQHTYTPPRVGGSFKLTPKEFIKNEFFIKFAEKN